jgi:tetraacyldisaccharide 4'-kinase
VARLAERVYRAEVARRNRRFDARRGVVTIDRPVISVGNLSVGGTGKTPMVQRLVGWLREAGHRPAIAMRGYRARGGLSDEAAAHADAFAGEVPVVAQPDRLEGLLRLFATDAGRAVDVVVLDDGFQHRRIARQLDLVLADASRPFDGDRCLPAGWLREPPASLARASAVVITHAELVDASGLRGVLDAIRAHAPAAVHAVCAHAWDGLVVAGESSEETRPVAWLAGRRVAAACAIAHPEAFFAAAERAVGGPLAARLALRDHDPIGPGTCARLAQLARGCEVLLVTEKDWTKLRRRDPARMGVRVARPTLSLAFREGESDLRERVVAAAGLSV